MNIAPLITDYYSENTKQSSTVMTVYILDENALVLPLMFFNMIHSLFPTHFPEKNHRLMEWVEMNLKCHTIPSPMLWTGTLFTIPGSSETHPT